MASPDPAPEPDRPLAELQFPEPSGTYVPDFGLPAALMDIPVIVDPPAAPAAPFAAALERLMALPPLPGAATAATQPEERL